MRSRDDIDGIDTTALTAPIDRDALRRFRDQLPTSVVPPLRSVLLSGGLVLVVLVSSGAWIFLFAELFTEPDAGDLVVMGMVLATYLALTILLAVHVVGDLRRRSGRRQYLLDRFARANRMEYVPTITRPPLTGMIFGYGEPAIATDVLMRRGTVPFSVANYAYSTGSGRNREQHRWGYVAMRLPIDLPHIVLDARGNNTLGRSNLPVQFAGRQQLGLEGDFDRHFTLYCPEGYEADALYLFTPDVMARFIDRAAELDVEIVDDHLFLYSRRELSTLDPETWTWLLSVIDALAQKTEQWRRWRDTRLGDTRVVFDGAGANSHVAAGRIIRPPRGVAKQGRRLRPKTEWVWIVIGVPLFLFGVYSFISDVVKNIWG